MDYQQLLIEHLEIIERIVRLVARRHRLSSADAEEFASVVRLKLVDKDFAILRKFERRSKLTTYLTVVIERLCHDFCHAKWGSVRRSYAPAQPEARAPDDRLLARRVEAALSEAIATLSPDDKEIVRLRFDAGLPIAQIARSLGLEPRPLYRRLGRIIRVLRDEMQRRGIDGADIARVIGHPEVSMGGVLIETERARSR